VLGPIWREPPPRLGKLALAGTGAAGHARVVPSDRDVDEPLEEVPLGRLGRAPGVLERLVSLEEPPRADQREAALVSERGLAYRVLRRRA
jgi:hypothetical protein